MDCHLAPSMHIGPWLDRYHYTTHGTLVHNKDLKRNKQIAMEDGGRRKRKGEEEMVEE